MQALIFMRLFHEFVNKTAFTREKHEYVASGYNGNGFTRANRKNRNANYRLKLPFASIVSHEN